MRCSNCGVEHLGEDLCWDCEEVELNEDGGIGFDQAREEPIMYEDDYDYYESEEEKAAFEIKLAVGEIECQNPHADWPILSTYMEYGGEADITMIAYYNKLSYLCQLDEDYIDF